MDTQNHSHEYDKFLAQRNVHRSLQAIRSKRSDARMTCWTTMILLDHFFVRGRKPGSELRQDGTDDREERCRAIEWKRLVIHAAISKGREGGSKFLKSIELLRLPGKKTRPNRLGNMRNVRYRFSISMLSRSRS